MSKLESILNVDYHNNRYTIVGIAHNNNKLPIVLDRHIYKKIKKFDKQWYINDKNHVYCPHNNNRLYLHDLVMRANGEYKNEPVIHINNIHFDNRFENLQYDTQNKTVSKSSKKKKRTIDLKNKNIDVNNLPTYIWYVKPDNTHGDRFMVDIPNELSWKTTSSKKVSLVYKLEEAKKFLRYTKNNRPDIFENYSMNGDLTKQGYTLYKEYNNIIRSAGFSIDIPRNNDTDKHLIQDTSLLNDFEKYILNQFDPSNNNMKIDELYKNYYR